MALNKPKENETVVSDEDLIKAEERFKEAVKLVYSEPERSVMLLGQVKLCARCFTYVNVLFQLNVLFLRY